MTQELVSLPRSHFGPRYSRESVGDPLFSVSGDPIYFVSIGSEGYMRFLLGVLVFTVQSYSGGEGSDRREGRV